MNRGFDLNGGTGSILAQDRRVRVAMAETGMGAHRMLCGTLARRPVADTGMAGHRAAGPCRSGSSRTIHTSQEYIRAVFRLRQPPGADTVR